MSASFQTDWFNDPDLNIWIDKVKDDPKKAQCKLCNISFSLSNMGRTAVNSHAKGIKHKKKVEGCKKTPSLSLLWNSPSSKTVVTETLVASNDPPQPKTTVATKTISSFVLKENVSKAEIFWCLQTLMHHKSMRSAGSDVRLFQSMFSDSEIAKKMELQRTKVAYSILYGIAPFLKDKLLNQIKNCEYFVIGFDESLNKVAQQSQMDLNIRFWDDEKNEVSTRYLTSAFLERTRAVDLLNAFKQSLTPVLSLKRILQISMDGPNVNFKFLKDLNTDLSSDGDVEAPKMVSMGSCGLHKMHGAFKNAVKVTGWNIVEFLRALYYVFKDVPLRRAQLTEYSGSTVYPKKFCSIRWLENDSVAARAIEVIPNVIKMVEGLKSDKNAPVSNSFRTVSEAVSDPLLEAKLEFFRSLCAEASQFLAEFQTDNPMAPFVYNSMITIIKNVMSRFIKKEVIDSAKSLVSVDLSDKKNLVSFSDIDLGYGTRKALRRANREKKIPDYEVTRFRKDAAKALKSFSENLIRKSPLQYNLTKAVSCFDPSQISMPSIRDTRIKLLLSILSDHNWISGIAADETARDFSSLCSNSSVQEKFKTYSRSTMRLDHFWMDLIKTNFNRQTLLSLTKMVMVLSHGNANVERGFSVNAECLVENMKNETLIAQRLVYDCVKNEANGEVGKIEISKALILSYRNARARLTEETERRKKENSAAESERDAKKRVALEKKELNAKKAKLMAEIQAIDEQVESLV